MNAAPSSPWPDALVDTLLADLQPGGAPQVLGISGLQGTGKSTLAAQVMHAAEARGLRAAVLSLDDLYLDRDARQALAREVHPLLATRGPPGTHEIALGLAAFDAARTGKQMRLPRFDKLGDRRVPETDWPTVDGLDLLLFEGWCVGTPPEPATALVEPVNALERDEDPAGTWRRWCNTALARDYPALWAGLDRLLFLQPPGFDVVFDWRLQQEQALQAAQPGRGGMDASAVARFVQHYERVSRQALRSLPTLADTVVTLDARRRIVTAH
ncbi:kinase [Luteimonas sp. 3794]|uniref:kinase n=1 Tax=Luteimonas sp. 3794 TaxID=2817730 RepID=UPI002857FCE4|nr:kinase [Luteimonas sp. 3794]MDR6991416.1 D-glycerate 3-kinase [Luteimonas sp. 3794]